MRTMQFAKSKSRRIAFISAASLLILIISIVAVARRGGEAAERRKVFDQAWKAVDQRFFDRTMSGLDWVAVRKNFEQKLDETASTTDLYWKVLMPMLALLESSHVRAISPVDAQIYSSLDLPMAAMPATNLESCGGFVASFFQRQVASRVVRVDGNSFLASRGIRAGWRFLGASGPGQNASVNALIFMSPAADQVTIETQVPGWTLDLAALEKDLMSHSALRAKEVDPATEVRFESLGMEITAGKSIRPITVSDVIKDSEAERAGVEPGSVITHFRRQNGTDGVFTVEAKLVSPAGAPYSAAFEFRMCDVPDRSATVLPGNVLHLRFNSFQDDVAPWIDAQLLQDPSAVVLDLRTNGGGSAAAMLEIIGRFLAAGTSISEVMRADRTETFRATDAPHSFKGPVAVLIGSMSASAAEVTASALRFHDRAKLYGSRTSGDVLLSSNFRLLDGGIVQVAIADMRGPDGNRIENIGVKPDFEIMPTLESIRAGRDVVLEAALTDLKQTLH